MLYRAVRAADQSPVCAARDVATRDLAEWADPTRGYVSGVKILVVTNMYPTQREPWFGVFVKEQIDSIRSAGVDVDVFSFDARPDSRIYLRAARLVRTLVSSKAFDLVHAHYGLTGAVALAQRSVPVVTTFHGSETGEVPWQAWVSSIVARASTPIFVSNQNAEALGFSGAAVIPCGIDLSFFTPKQPAEARRILGWDQRLKYVLLPGGKRNGSKAPWVFDAALAEARRRGLRVEGVSLEGYSRDEVVNVMNAIDVMLMTSRWEGSPMTVKESLACCTPVVSVPVGDVEEILPGLPGCFVVERDPKALAQALLEAIEAGKSPTLRLSLARCSQDEIARRVIDVYERVAAPKL